MISCFTYESRHILKSFSLFLTVRMITNWILNTAMNLNKKIRNNNLARYTSPDNAEFGHFMFVVLRRTAKKCTKNYNARAQPLFFSLILLFSDVPVAVSVAVSWTPQSLFRVVLYQALAGNDVLSCWESQLSFESAFHRTIQFQSLSVILNARSFTSMSQARGSSKNQYWWVIVKAWWTVRRNLRWPSIQSFPLSFRNLS